MLPEPALFSRRQMPSAASRPEKLLCYTLRPEITEQKVLANKIAFRGNANLHVAWLEEDGSVGAQDFPMPFSQVAELRGSFSPDARVDIGCCVTDLEVEVGEMGQLLTKCGLTAQYLVDDLQWLETVEDIVLRFALFQRGVSASHKRVRCPLV